MATPLQSHNSPFIHIAWLCERGLVRTANSDALLVQKRWGVLSASYGTGSSDIELSSDPLFLGVAGGYGGGEHKAHTDHDILRYIANKVFSSKLPGMCEELLEIVQDANRYLNGEPNRRVGRPAGGATLTVALVDDRKATIAQVGNPKCYLYRNNKLYQGGVDQALVKQLIQAGQITAEEAQLHPHNGIFSSTFNLDDRDWLLLLTDGIWGHVGGDLIEETARDATSALAVVTRLKSRAIENGGHDNLSIIATRVSIPGREPICGR